MNRLSKGNNCTSNELLIKALYVNYALVGCESSHAPFLPANLNERTSQWNRVLPQKNLFACEETPTQRDPDEDLGQVEKEMEECPPLPLFV